MKLGLGLYGNMLNAENFRFAKQAGASHIVAHIVGNFNKDRAKTTSGLVVALPLSPPALVVVLEPLSSSLLEQLASTSANAAKRSKSLLQDRCFTGVLLGSRERSI